MKKNILQKVKILFRKEVTTMLINLINLLCYLYVRRSYKKNGRIPLEFGGGRLINDLGFHIEVGRYGKWVEKDE